MLRICREDAVDLAEALGYAGAAEWRQHRLERRIIELIQLNEDGGLVIEKDRVEDDDERERLTGLLSKILASDGEITITKEREEVLDDSEDVPPVEDDEDDEDDMGDAFDEDDDEDGSSTDPDDVEGDDEPTGRMVAVGEEDKDEETKSKSKKKKKELSDTDKKIAAAQAEVKRLKDVAKEERRLKKVEAKVNRASKKKRANAGPEIGGNPVGISSLRNRLFCAGVVLKESGLGDGLTDELVEKVNEAIGGEPKDKASKTQLGWAWHAINGYLNG